MPKVEQMFIDIPSEKVPYWDPKKHYYDQTWETIEFWEHEKKKITDGIKIGGWHMSGWLYFHLNHFKTPVPIAGKHGVIDKVMNPPFTDNDLLVAESLVDAKKRNKILTLFGTRGFFKSTYIASYAHHSILTKAPGIFKIVGGSAEDLAAISTLLQTTFENIHPALFIPTLKKDWDKSIIFGVKDKANSGRAYVYAEISIVNADDEKKKSEEKGAGGSPIGLVIDEAGKFDPTKILSSMQPAFRTPHGYRFIPLICGTSGSLELAKPIKGILENPNAWEVLPFNYERLSRGVPEECKTWRDDKNKLFGTFVPGQMSGRISTKKVKKTLAEFLGFRNEALSKITINVTDWKNATEEIKQYHRLADTSGKIEDKKNQMYYPLEIDDIFQTIGHNPLPVHEINRRIRELELEGKTGKPIELYKDGLKVRYNFSQKERAKIEHPGGSADAPGFLFSEFPEEEPEKYTFVSGLDDYKSDTAYTDSLGAFYVVKRRNLGLNTPCETIAYSYVSRPDRHDVFHNQCQFALETWNSDCLMEAADTTFVSHLDRQGKAYRYLTPALTFAPSKDKKSGKPLANTYGLFPTTYNNTFRMNVFINWCREEHTVGMNEDGVPIKKLSVEFIDDIDLLKEMAGYKHGKNVDRVVAFSHAILRCHLLDQDKILPKQLSKDTSPIPYHVEKPKRKYNNNKYGIPLHKLRR